MADYSYDAWLELFREQSRRRMPLAMAIVINHNAVLRIRSSSGDSKDVVLYGKNPLEISTAEGTLHIRHVSFSRVPFGQSPLESVVFFVDAGRNLSEATALRFAQVLAADRRHPRPHASHVAPPDRWFLESEDFPPFDTFTSSLSAPSLIDYLKSTAFVCGTTGVNQSCRKQEHLWQRRP